MKEGFITFGLCLILAFFTTMLLLVIDLCLNKIKDILKKKSQLFKGLTKREYFAVKAMQGIITNKDGLDIKIERIVESAVDTADALIEELNKTR
jgi:hypothetical protein